MKFKHLAYGKDEEIFAIYSEHFIQLLSRDLIGRELKPSELILLNAKMVTEINNLIIKIDSSGIGE